MEGPIFRNSKRFINEGTGKGKGLLYCGEQYAKNEGCPCGGCDGYCGLNNGCPCPDCDNTLAYLLYSSGKMICRTCKNTLIRIKVCELKLLILNPGYSDFSCSFCYKNYQNEGYIPLLHCFKCKFNMCPECAFAKIEKFEQKMPKLELGIKESTGIIFCTNNYTTSSNCICKGCDGNCGPENGCACPLCDAILGYNIYLKKMNMHCKKCNSLLIKTKILYLQKAKKGNSFVCSYCHETDKDDYLIIYRCNKCKQTICNRCAFKFNIGYINKIVLPRIPIYKDNFDTVYKERKIKEQKENAAQYQICKQKKFRLGVKKASGNVICLYLKTLIGRIFTINIDEAFDIMDLKRELNNLDRKYEEDNVIFIFKNKILVDDAIIQDCELKNESLINVILK
jgi:hypothetical protein